MGRHSRAHEAREGVWWAGPEAQIHGTWQRIFASEGWG